MIINYYYLFLLTKRITSLFLWILFVLDYCFNLKYNVVSQETKIDHQ